MDFFPKHWNPKMEGGKNTLRITCAKYEPNENWSKKRETKLCFETWIFVAKKAKKKKKAKQHVLPGKQTKQEFHHKSYKSNAKKKKKLRKPRTRGGQRKQTKQHVHSVRTPQRIRLARPFARSLPRSPPTTSLPRDTEWFILRGIFRERGRDFPDGSRLPLRN